MIAIGGAVPADAQRAERASLRAGADARAIHIDGRLDEPEWGAADSIANLTQVEPSEGTPAPGRTVVRVLADGRRLVIGIVAYTPPGATLVSFSKARDASLRSEDHVMILLDTFRDERTGYLFAVNPEGARYDALVSGQGEDSNSNWDGIWEAAAVRFDGGWSAEIRIPVSTIAFRPDLDSWGFNVERRVQSLLATDRWASPRRDAKIGQGSRAGLLVGLPRFTLGTGLTVRPSVTGGVGLPALRPEPGDPRADLHAPFDGQFDGSLDVEQRITPNLLAALSLNTDFAETEVDTRQTNLTRFPLFFPEKRTFFLEGADVYEFGLGLGSDVIPFFSRRMGLLGNEPVPIRGAVKVNGQVGGTRVGAVAARTGALDSVAGTSMGAVRVRQDVLSESSVGMIATAGDPRGRPGSWTAGFDAIYRTSRFLGTRNLLAGAWLLTTGRAEAAGDRTAFGARIDYPNDLFDLAVTWRRIGTEFDPSLGFVPRRGVHQLTVAADISPRPERFGIRQMFFENRFTLVTDLDGRWESYRMFWAPVNFRFESGDRIEVNANPQGERLTEPFEIADGVEIGPGMYRFTRYRLEIETAARRAWSGQLTWWFGGFYSGRLHQLEAELAWKPSPNASVQVEVEHNIGTLPGDAGSPSIGYSQTVASAQLRLNFSPTLQVNSLVQYDTESREIGANTRMRWTLTPATEFFLVYNHNVVDRFDRWALKSSELLAKLRHAFRP